MSTASDACLLMVPNNLRAMAASVYRSLRGKTWGEGNTRQCLFSFEGNRTNMIMISNFFCSVTWTITWRRSEDAVIQTDTVKCFRLWLSQCFTTNVFQIYVQMPSIYPPLMKSLPVIHKLISKDVFICVFKSSLVLVISHGNISIYCSRAQTTFIHIC